jgi:hypothetical protein
MYRPNSGGQLPQVHPRPNLSAFRVCETRRVPEQPTWESVYRFLVQLPETEFDPGRMVFPNGVVRVHGKVIAYPAGGDRGSPTDALPGEEFVFVKAASAEREALLHGDPATFFLTPHYANAPGVIVRLSRVDPDALRELLVDAWRTVAPKRLVKAYDQSAM